MFFFFKQKTAYEMRISDSSSDVCSSDLDAEDQQQPEKLRRIGLSDLLELRHRPPSAWNWPLVDQATKTRMTATTNASRPRSSAAAKPMNRRPCWLSAAEGLRSAPWRNAANTLPTPRAARPIPIAASSEERREGKEGCSKGRI